MPDWQTKPHDELLKCECSVTLYSAPGWSCLQCLNGHTELWYTPRFSDNLDVKLTFCGLHYYFASYVRIPMVFHYGWEHAISDSESIPAFQRLPLYTDAHGASNMGVAVVRGALLESMRDFLFNSFLHRAMTWGPWIDLGYTETQVWPVLLWLCTSDVD